MQNKMTFIDVLSHGMPMAYQRKDGSFSFWRLDKEALKNTGAMHLTSLIPGGHQPFPVNDYKKVYPLICGTEREVFYSYQDNAKYTFLYFKFPDRRIAQDKTSVVIQPVNNRRSLTIEFEHFVNNFRSENAVLCEL